MGSRWMLQQLSQSPQAMPATLRLCLWTWMLDPLRALVLLYTPVLDSADQHTPVMPEERIPAMRSRVLTNVSPEQQHASEAVRP